MPTVVGKMTRGAVFPHVVDLGAVGTNTPTAKTVNTDRLVIDTDVASYIVDGEGAADDDIDGISGFNAGQLLLLIAATGRTITLKDENAGAAAATDKIRTMGGADQAFGDDEAVLLYHDETLNRWVVIAGPIAGGGGAHADSHEPQTGVDPLDCAAPPADITPDLANDEGNADTLARSDHIHNVPTDAPNELIGVQATFQGSDYTYAQSDHDHQIQHSIADNHLVTIDGDPNAGEYGRFTADGIEGRTIAEVVEDIKGSLVLPFYHRIYIQYPGATDAFEIAHIHPLYTVTLTKVTGVTTGGTVDFNLNMRANLTPDVAGDDVWVADKVAGDGGAELEEEAFDDGTVAAEERLWYAASAVAGSPTELWVTIFGTMVLA